MTTLPAHVTGRAAAPVAGAVRRAGRFAVVWENVLTAPMVVLTVLHLTTATQLRAGAVVFTAVQFSAGVMLVAMVLVRRLDTRQLLIASGCVGAVGRVAATLATVVQAPFGVLLVCWVAAMSPTYVAFVTCRSAMVSPDGDERWMASATRAVMLGSAVAGGATAWLAGSLTTTRGVPLWMLATGGGLMVVGSLGYVAAARLSPGAAVLTMHGDLSSIARSWPSWWWLVTAAICCGPLLGVAEPLIARSAAAPEAWLAVAKVAAAAAGLATPWAVTRLRPAVSTSLVVVAWVTMTVAWDASPSAVGPLVVGVTLLGLLANSALSVVAECRLLRAGGSRMSAAVMSAGRSAAVATLMAVFLP